MKRGDARRAVRVERDVMLGITDSGSERNVYVHPNALAREIFWQRLDAIFDFVFIEGEFGVGKPHPSVFTTAMAKLNVAASDTWMVGDDLERDIAGAQRLGIYSIWVDWREAGLPQSSMVLPDHIVRSITHLAKESP